MGILMHNEYQADRWIGKQKTGMYVQELIFANTAKQRPKGEKFYISFRKIEEILELLDDSKIIEGYLGRKQVFEHIVREIVTASPNIVLRSVGNKGTIYTKDNLDIPKIMDKIKKNINIPIYLDNILKQRKSQTMITLNG